MHYSSVCPRTALNKPPADIVPPAIFNLVVLIMYSVVECSANSAKLLILKLFNPAAPTKPKTEAEKCGGIRTGLIATPTHNHAQSA